MIRMDDPLGVMFQGQMGVPCQIVKATRVEQALLLDIATVGPNHRGREALPAGTVLALGFKFGSPSAKKTKLDGIVDRWVSKGTVLNLEAQGEMTAIRYVITSGRDTITLVAQ
jgi:hypothetical protein